MHISLAAKCQLLFGAAVVLIISAALFVPWHRMEQLTEQLNQRSARTLADYTVIHHAESRRNASPAAPATQPATGTLAFAPPTTAPAAPEASVRADEYPTPRLILVRGKADSPDLTPFERYAVRKLAEHPEREFVFRYHEEGYHFARVDTGCIRCHSAEAPATTRPASIDWAAVPGGTALAAALPSAAPATAPAGPLAIGIVAVDIPSQIEASQVLLNRVFLLSAGLLAGTLAIVVFYLITTRLILQPVRVLQETAEKVSEGDLNIRSDINTGDEFQQLSETFNVMLANLKNSADQLRAVNKSLDLKLGQLAESNLALYESNRLKSEFLANVSHELRTPLNSILGFADLLKDTSGLSADSKAGRYLQNILRSGRHLLDLINDLLDLAKIEAGRMDVRSEPLSLNDLFEGLVSLLKPLTEPRKLSIVTAVLPDVPIVHTDPAKLQQVLYNFLSNAIKFSPEGGRIDLTAAPQGDEAVRISVSDQGPGVPPDKTEIIFEKFRQVDASVTREHGGTGLGLAISRELTALLSGSIGVESPPGSGATFWITIPTAIEAGAQEVGAKLVLT